ncbi:MAG: hypothetical protein M3O31_13260 [Acidobacteriota bacterium]|nr:hypothetical protein [Acidobacteriota bacterium]
MGNFNDPPGASQSRTLSGVVHGGQQPVSGATVQLYAANMTADFGASTPLLTSTVKTASDGSFSITGQYTCPVTNPPVYLVSTGGNPGLAAGTNNTDIVLMASLGLCNTLTSSTYVVINEFSTVGMTYLLAPFMQDATHIGASATNPGGMVYYFTSAVFYNNRPFGQTGAAVLPALELNTFSNILAACVNSPGGTSGDGSPCGKLLAATGAADTATASMKMTQTPSNNASQLFALISGTPPFQPYFSGVPSDFSATVGYTLPANTRSATLDSNGRFWIYTGGWLYDTVADTSTDVQGIITVYDGNFNPLFTVSPGTGGLYYPDSLASDAKGHVFAANANNTISEFNSAGGAISPIGGWSTGIATVFTGTAIHQDQYVDGSSQVGPIGVDALGNIWGETLNGSCYFEMNSSGTVITPAGGNGCATLGGSISVVAALDGLGNAWAGSNSTIVKINSAGNVAATAPLTVGCFAPSSGSGVTSDTQTKGLFYDSVHGQVWGYSNLGAGVISNAGAAVFCDATPTTIPTIAPPPFSLYTTGNPVSLSGLTIDSATLDGAGNLWFATGGVSANGTAASATTISGTVKYTAWVGEISPSGTVLSPFNAGAGIYGYQPAGAGMNVSANLSNSSVFTSNEFSLGVVGVDNAGNLWLSDTYTRRIIKVTGLATANTVNY